MKKTIVTGIKPTGKVHLGNYIGAIKPALELAKNKDYQPVYFIADYHGLTKIHNGEELRDLSYGIAATWIALGLDPAQFIFYRQSDVPEIFELNWILSCFASKGLLNRAHAYKSMVDANQQAGRDPDTGVNIGLFTYPVLMAADILLFKSSLVPVGKDQQQHVEIARDIAEVFNKAYGDTFHLPTPKIEKDSSVILGLDGRKMSKSYNNTIPLFEESKKLKKLINKIKTDSLPPEAPKDPDSSTIFSLYKQFAEEAETKDFHDRLLKGIGWGEAKQELFQVMDRFLSEPREKYHELISSPAQLDDILTAGADKARNIAAPFLKEIRGKVGL
ncbi:tryptophan--tRNA ligase [Falsibacillus albus]|uniref:Tryptophan--tRNA ligase n=1 Tax=Falsibacillus albus TaxID=2478915 RepID=A0A3L7JNF0_9BACI|nr:tryptophan--tRNA ligase [Falsibacillus albus]RLQ91795.1 tryptophan--tRNA ligase [Falsibacillus albus]